MPNSIPISVVVAALALIPAGPGRAETFPNPAPGCRAAQAGWLPALPDGTLIGFNYPDSLVCVEGALVTAPGGVAIGADATAGFPNSTALGRGATTTAHNQVTLGGPGSSVRIGDIGASTAAQTGALGLATVDAAGTLGRDFTILPSIQRKLRQGVAAALAMGNSSMPSAPGRTSYDFNLATFRGEEAFGGSVMYRFRSAAPVALSLGFSYGANHNSAARIGVAGEF